VVFMTVQPIRHHNRLEDPPSVDNGSMNNYKHRSGAERREQMIRAMNFFVAH